MKTKPCLNCGKTIIKPQTESLKNWGNRHKYCSRKCLGIVHTSNVGNNTRFKFGQKAINPIKKGQHLSKKTQFKKGLVPWNKNTKGLMPIPWNKGKRHKVSGNKHWNWKDGISKLNHLIRNLPEMKNWKKSIYVRDNYTCQNCGQIGGKLNVHHKKSFSIILKENNITTIQEALNCKELLDISNGKTLCISCHKLTDNYLRNYKLN